jgi:hypothetical protein
MTTKSVPTLSPDALLDRLRLRRGARVRSGHARHENGAPRLSTHSREGLHHGNHFCTTVGPAGG